MTEIKSLFNKKWIRVVATIGLVLLLLQVSFYYASDLLLRNYIQQKVKEVSNNKYEIDFEEFHISLLQRGFSFKNFYLIPKEENLGIEKNQPYYKAFIPEVSIYGLFYQVSKKEVQIGEFRVKNPLVDFFMPNPIGETSKSSTLKILEDQIKKSFLESSIKEIRIKRLVVEEADLLLKNFVYHLLLKLHMH
jgi:hypothetical protein